MTDDKLFNELDYEPNPVSPAHYRTHPSGIECKEISKHLSGCLAQAFQYVWRCGQKDDPVQELRKATWFIAEEFSIEPEMVCRNLSSWSIVNEKIFQVIEHETDENKANALSCISMANYKEPEQRLAYLTNASYYLQKIIEAHEIKRPKPN